MNSDDPRHPPISGKIAWSAIGAAIAAASVWFVTHTASDRCAPALLAVEYRAAEVFSASERLIARGEAVYGIPGPIWLKARNDETADWFAAMAGLADAVAVAEVLDCPHSKIKSATANAFSDR